jgi:antitoxin (DNA-binding transcriptional repressor) of toxin-antitoxin stability system
MKNLSIRELRQRLGELPTVLQEEGEVVVTRRDQPIARILPLTGTATQRPSHADLRARLRRQPASSEETIRRDRDERG